LLLLLLLLIKERKIDLINYYCVTRSLIFNCSNYLYKFLFFFFFLFLNKQQAIRFLSYFFCLHHKKNMYFLCINSHISIIIVLRFHNSKATTDFNEISFIAWNIFFYGVMVYFHSIFFFKSVGFG
jgi:hypothetical protein